MNSTYQAISLSPHIIDSTYPEVIVVQIRKPSKEKAKLKKKSKENKEQAAIRKSDIEMASLL